MTVFTEGRHFCEGIVSEGDGHYSRDAVTIGNNQTIIPGTVLGRKLYSNNRTAAAAAFTANAGSTGTVTMDATAPFKAAAKTGVYTLTCIVAGAPASPGPAVTAVFRLEDPDGIFVAEIPTSGSAYDGDLKFVLATGATLFSVGEGFKITITDNFRTITAAAGSNTGVGTITMAGTPAVDGVAEGRWTATCIAIAAGSDAAKFELTSPVGVSDGNPVAGTAYTGSLKFTIAQTGGQTAFAVGDTFTIDVNYGYNDKSYGAVDFSATDGSQYACAVALYPATTGASTTAKIAALTRTCEFRAEALGWPTGATYAQKMTARDQLAAQGIIIRD
jgi:hypothetical protein